MQAISEDKPKTTEGVPLKFHALLLHTQKNHTDDIPHYHSYIELIYCLSGSYCVWLDDKYYAFSTGDLVIINSNEIHKFRSFEDSGSYIVVKFEPEILYDSPIGSFDAKYVFPFIIKDASPQKIFSCNEISSTDIPHLMHNIYSEYENHKYGFELAIKSDICQVFLQILRYWDSSGIQIPQTNTLYSEHIRNIKKVLDYISLHINEEISAEAMAKQAGLSYAYFSRVFKQLIGRSFNDYLNFIRITEAERLLIATDLSITDIAGHTGFSSSSYFIKVFEKYQKISPTQFRTNFKKIKTGADS